MLVFSLAIFLSLFPLQQEERVRVACGGGETPEVVFTGEPGDMGVVRCSSGAVVTYQDIRVDANWIEFDPVTNQLTAGDRVRFRRAGEELSGGHLSFNVKDKTARFTDASGQIQGWILNAENYERLEDGTWRMIRLNATACTGDCPMWNIRFKEALLTPEKDFIGTNMVFRIRSVPIFYFPKFRVPSGDKERSTGFLIPSTSTSTTKGRSFRQAFFWAIDRSYDATFTGEYLSMRGPTGLIDFRAVPNDRTNLNVNTFFAIDRKDQGGYRTRIRGSTSFGEDWRALTEVDVTSSFEFRQVFEEGFNQISSPIERSIGFLTKNGPRSSLNFLFNRTAVFFPDQGSTVLRKSPAVELQLPSREIGGRIPVYFSMDGSFASTSRRDSQIDSPAFMQRVDAYPSLQIPLLRSSLLTWSHQVGFRETLYTHAVDSGSVTSNGFHRGVFDYAMKVTGPQLEKNYGSWKHLIEPTAEYRYVAGIGSRFLKTIVVDENDLFADTNEVEYGITSRFMGGHEFLTWRIAQKLYFDPQFGGALIPGRRNTLEPLMYLSGFAFSFGEARRFSPVVSTIRIATTPQTSTDIEADYDTRLGEFRSAGVLGSLNRGLFGASIGYFFNKRTEIQSPSNQLRGLFTYGSHGRRGVNVGFGFYYDIYRSIFQGSTTQVGYNAECYGLSVEFTQYDIGPRIENRLRFSFSFKNLGSIGTLSPQERMF
jgi:LPS-assembly protein